MFQRLLGVLKAYRRKRKKDNKTDWTIKGL